MSREREGEREREREGGKDRERGRERERERTRRRGARAVRRRDRAARADRAAALAGGRVADAPGMAWIAPAPALTHGGSLLADDGDEPLHKKNKTILDRMNRITPDS